MKKRITMALAALGLFLLCACQAQAGDTSPTFGAEATGPFQLLGPDQALLTGSLSPAPPQPICAGQACPALAKPDMQLSVTHGQP